MKIQKFYLEEWKGFGEKFLKIFIFVIIIFVLTAFFCHVFLVNHPDQAKKIAADLAKSFLKKFPKEAAGLRLCFAIFLNNLRVTFLCILFGLIPFLFLPILGTFVNGFMIGVVTSLSYLKGFKTVPVLLLSIVPHGIFEVPAVLYASSLGIYLSLQVSKKILFIYRSHGEPLFTLFAKPQYPGDTEPLCLLFKRIFKTLVGVIIPLLFLAAIIETFVTPFLAKIFLE